MKTLIVAPHPDDEILGAGGALLRRKAEGGTLAWVVVTAVPPEFGWDEEKISRREGEISKIVDLIGFDKVYRLGFPAAGLDSIPTGELVSSISGVFSEFEPEEVFVPHPSDVHTDHRLVFEAVSGCCKWFRYPSVRRVLAYEVLSETDFGLGVSGRFNPNVFVDIGPYMDAKLEAMRIYSSEMGEFPFPRSEKAIRALAAVRGAASGFYAAEAFELLRDRI
ncbi:N-acetylglucosaminyl deacetylase, LmbE family [Formivibrio citricus]|uniref:N-acetylglucosaminyl deacetylase, LmbE family n=1 Tax=Formivibrio citricus TaxID=83765 RepID=A0A1I4XV68_9NEIS|nr:PIG-L deacetylase family protein [Formivibrio citricus]SFN29788.1 N-acetylglucosaminyl deacetylase, LmbE family [Formivibrio citricus]